MPVAVIGLIVVPTGAVVGEMDVSVGTGLLIVKLTEFDAPPPGVGLLTVTGITAADGSSVATMLAVMVVPPLETVPTLFVPLKLTIAPVTKFVPVTVNVEIA